MFELTDAVLCADGAVKSPVDLTLLPEHRRGHGAMCGGLNHGRIDVEQVRTVLAGLSLPRFDGGRLVLAVVVSPWLRSDAPCSAERLFCHVYGRAKTASQFIPGWPYSSSPSWSQVPLLGPRSWMRSGSDQQNSASAAIVCGSGSPHSRQYRRAVSSAPNSDAPAVHTSRPGIKNTY
ncbi:transposase [Streptomyces collinus]